MTQLRPAMTGFVIRHSSFEILSSLGISLFGIS